MGLFSKKKKFSVEDMSMQTTLAATAAVGKLIMFNDMDDIQSMAVGIGYFCGFLRLHLSRITNSDVANTIIDQSIGKIESATKEKPEYKNFGQTARAAAYNASDKMQYAKKDVKENPFLGMAVFYLSDLYNSTTIDVSKMDVAEKNMRMLYGRAADLTRDIKIVK